MVVFVLVILANCERGEICSFFLLAYAVYVLSVCFTFGMDSMQTWSPSDHCIPVLMTCSIPFLCRHVKQLSQCITNMNMVRPSGSETCLSIIHAILIYFTKMTFRLILIVDRGNWYNIVYLKLFALYIAGKYVMTAK